MEIAPPGDNLPLKGVEIDSYGSLLSAGEVGHDIEEDVGSRYEIGIR